MISKEAGESFRVGANVAVDHNSGNWQEVCGTVSESRVDQYANARVEAHKSLVVVMIPWMGVHACLRKCYHQC